MRKTKLYWLLQLLGWGLYFSANYITVSFDPQGLGEEAVAQQKIQLIIHSAVLFLISHFFVRSIIIWRKWFNINIVRIIPRILGINLLAGVLGAVISYVLYLAWGTVSSDDPFITELLISTLAYSIIFILWSTIYFLYHFLQSYNQTLKYEAAINEMHLNQLKAQLNPHFIFNALNSMRALVDEEPLKAKIAITQLSNILRNSLITDKKRTVNFGNELNTVKDYLALEGIRFEERLSVSYSIHPGSYRFDVPPMMMQTLVENAIKHGVSNLMKGGVIEIKTEVADSFLILSIKNSGHLVEKAMNGNTRKGVGLENTRERLKLIYGEAASFKIYNENNNFVITEVKIPQRI